MNSSHFKGILIHKFNKSIHFFRSVKKLNYLSMRKAKHLTILGGCYDRPERNI